MPCAEGQNSLIPWGNSNLNFRLARDHVVLLETAANLWASRRKANNFFAVFLYFWVGRYNNTVNDWPRGKQWVLFPLDLNVSLGGTLRVSGKQNSLFPAGPVNKCLLSTQLMKPNHLVILPADVAPQFLYKLNIESLGETKVTVSLWPVI